MSCELVAHSMLQVLRVYRRRETFCGLCFDEQTKTTFGLLSPVGLCAPTQRRNRPSHLCFVEPLRVTHPTRYNVSDIDFEQLSTPDEKHEPICFVCLAIAIRFERLVHKSLREAPPFTPARVEHPVFSHVRLSVALKSAGGRCRRTHSQTRGPRRGSGSGRMWARDHDCRHCSGPCMVINRATRLASEGHVSNMASRPLCRRVVGTLAGSLLPVDGLRKR